MKAKNKTNKTKKIKVTTKVKPELDIPMFYSHTIENSFGVDKSTLSNRYLVKFPDELEIKPFFVTNVNLPTINLIHTTIMGHRFFVKKEVGCVTFEFIDDSEIIYKLMNNINTNPNVELDYGVEVLDPRGSVLKRWEFKKCLIKTIDFSELSYDNDQMMKIMVTIKPMDMVLNS